MKSKINWWVWERPCTIHLVYIGVLGAQYPLKVWHGKPYADKLYGVFKKGMVRFMCDFDQIKTNGILILPDFLDADSYLQKRAKWDFLSKDLAKINQRILQTNLTQLTDEKLLKLYQEFNKIYLDWWGYTQVAELVSYGGEEILKNKLTPEQHKQYFSTLVTPTQKSWTNTEEEALLAIVKSAQEKGIDDLEVLKKIKEHTQKYYWIQNNFYDTVKLDKEYFTKIIKKYLADQAEVDKLIQDNDNRLVQVKEEKKKLIQELGFDSKTKALVWLLDDFCYLQDERKDLNMRANEVVDLFCKETARRKNIDYIVLRWATVPQIEALLSGQEVSLEQLKKQGEHSFIVFRDDTNETDVYVGELAETKEKEILGEEVDFSQVVEIEGSCASTGRAVGKVRVLLNPREVDQMQEGEILVSTMTSPDFVPAMRKAKAIVTDEGGITCHAAIVSRELGIPCVISTKIATKVLKTGDLVEIRANHGLVKIIK